MGSPPAEYDARNGTDDDTNNDNEDHIDGSVGTRHKSGIYESGRLPARGAFRSAPDPTSAGLEDYTDGLVNFGNNCTINALAHAVLCPIVEA